MKKLTFTFLGIICFVTMSIAQSAMEKAAPPSPTEKPQMSKEEKNSKEEKMSKEERMEMKAKEEARIIEAFKSAGLTDEEMTKAMDIMAEANKKMWELRSNEKMADDEKSAAKKEIAEVKNKRLQEIMGEERYKIYQEIRKKQKAEMNDKKATEMDDKKAAEIEEKKGDE